MPTDAPMRIPKGAWEAFAKVGNPMSVLDAVAACSRDVSLLTATETLQARVAEASGLPAADVRPVLTLLLVMHHYREAREESPEATWAATTTAIRGMASPEWVGSHFAAWEEAKPKVLALIHADHPFALLHKSSDLAHAHQNVLRDTQVITDLRPIFDSSRTTIRGAVLTHMLIIGYFDGSGASCHLHLALDADDIRGLREACIRAEQKATVTKKAMERPDFPILSGGEV